MELLQNIRQFNKIIVNFKICRNGLRFFAKPQSNVPLFFVLPNTDPSKRLEEETLVNIGMSLYWYW